MSYPPPPGLGQSTSSPIPTGESPARSALPPRPPPAAGLPQTFKPPTTFNNPPTFSSAPGTRGYNGTSTDTSSQKSGTFAGFAFQPRSLATQHQPTSTHNTTVAANAAPKNNTFSNPSYQAQTSYQQPQTQSLNQPSKFQEPYTDSTPPQIHNPFPLPGQFGAGRGLGRPQEQLDPEMEAQIAQWQSAYAGKDSGSSSLNRNIGNRFGEGNASSTGANTAPLGIRPELQGANMSNSAISSAANADTGVAAVVTGADGKQKTVIRSGGGQTWQDPSLLEWDPAHFRLFVGNLAGEVTDESLLKAFSKYSSVHKARVVRDKRTTKSKGYGFVSFVDGEEYFQAARDMQGKYIGSHPVLLRKSTTEIRPTIPKDQKKGGKHGRGSGRAGQGGVAGNNGVHKKHSKMKGGLKILG